MPDSVLDRFVHTPLGRGMVKLAQPVIHGVRRLRQPGVPMDQQLTRIQCEGKTLTVRHRRWNLHDALCLQQCFIEQQYDMPGGKQGQATRRFYEAIVNSGRIPMILDCGANIGASVMWFANRYPRAHFIAVEPAEDNCEMLQHNAIGYSVDIVTAAVGSEDGSGFLSDEHGRGMGYHVISDPTEWPTKIFSVASLLRSYDPERYVPFVLKIDIEGGERDLFGGDTAAIDRFPVIIVEPHDWMFPGQAVSANFIRFHVQSGREFSVRHENIASLAWDRLNAT